MFNKGLSFPAVSKTSLLLQHRLEQLFMVILGTVLLAISAHLTIPLLPVPVTMQSFVVLLLGMLYGSRLGLITVATYLFEGFIGMPVFTTLTGGLATFAGPTGAYLIGFLPAVYIAGLASERGWTKTRWGTLVTGLLAVSVIFACGVPGLARYLGWTGAVQAGLLPFVVTEVIKLTVLAMLKPATKRLQ